MNKTNDKTPNGELMWVKTDKVDAYGKISATVVLSSADAAEFNKRFEPMLLEKRSSEAAQRGIDQSLIEVRYPAGEYINDGVTKHIVQVGTKKTYTTKGYTKKDGTVVAPKTLENTPFVIDADKKDLVLPTGVSIGNGSLGSIAFSYEEAFVGVDKKTFKPYVSIPLRWEGLQVIKLVEYVEGEGVKKQDPRSVY